MKRALRIVVLAAAAAAFLAGCTVVTQDQKAWIVAKADRMAAYVKLIEANQTTAEQDRAMLRSDANSWSLWRDKINIGLAAPSFNVERSTLNVQR